MRTSLLATLLLLATASRGGASASHRSARNLLLGLEYALRRADNTCITAGQTVCNNDCSQVNMCVSDGLGGFQQVVVEQCGAQTRCSAELGTCVAGASGCGASPTGSINCYDTGYFPDPYDCTRYHLCIDVDITSLVLQCDPGYAYNPLTTDCSYSTTDQICRDGPVPACTHVSQSGPVPTNPSIYYFCMVDANGMLIPQLYRCPNGKIYTPALGCVDATPTLPPTTSTTTTTTTTTPTPTVGPTPPSISPGQPCWPPGVRLADPADCTHYYECGENLFWLHAACVFGTYFNPVHGHCELGWC